MDIKFIRCDGDSWEGLYINNELVLENHSLDVYEVLKGVQSNYMWGDKPIVSKYFIDDEWMKDEGSLPNDFVAIPKDKLTEV